jgi:hypothetical protein
MKPDELPFEESIEFMRHKEVSDSRNPQEVLEDELAALKNFIPFGDAINLEICWIPDPDPPVFGEVINQKIFLYDSNLKNAISTLRHEYLDFYLSKRLISPLMAIVNLFIELKTNEIYKEKEKVVDCLLKFIDLSNNIRK